MSSLLGKRKFLLHYAGNWGNLNDGKVVVGDYKGGKTKKVEFDGDELCFRDLKKELADLLKVTVNLDFEDGFRIYSIVDGMVFSILSDHTLLLWWNTSRPDIRGLVHLFTSTGPVTYAPSNRTLRSKGSHMISKGVTGSSQVVIGSSQAVTGSSQGVTGSSQVVTGSSQAVTGSSQAVSRKLQFTGDPSLVQFKHSVVSEWVDALEGISLDEFEEELPTNVETVRDVGLKGKASSVTETVDLSEDGVTVVEGVDRPDDDVELVALNDMGASSDEEDGDIYDHGVKYGPIVEDEEEYWSDHSSIPSDVEFNVEDEDDVSDSSEEEGDVGGQCLGNDELIHEGEETLEFLKMAADVYQKEDNDEGLDEGEIEKDIDTDLHVGMQWPTMKSCRRFIKRYALAKKFMYVQIKNDPTRLRLKCKDKCCGWYILCALQPDKFTVELRKLSAEHTCTADVDNKNCHAVAPLVASQYEEFMRTHTDCSPKMLANEVFAREGVRITYWVAWATRRRILKKINGSYEEAFKLVPTMCKTLEMHNEGSIIRWFKNEQTDEFTGLFVAFKASLKGWVEGCRPIIGLDGCFLKGKYGGACLSAMGLDAMNGLFPLAIYITTGEHKESWGMLCSLLQCHVNKHPEPITFISDRQKGLRQAVASWFPRAHHRFCFRHMYKNFKGDGNTGDYLEQMSWGAAKALKKSEHLDYMNVILGDSAKAHEWLSRESVETWARYAFDHTCKCDKITNNFNAWILKIRDKPIVQFIDKYILALTALMYERRMMSRELEAGRVVPKVMHIIERFMKKYHKFTIEGVDECPLLHYHGPKNP
ncbi:hypothetical protein ACHQM5_026418 [Ranunculus cassubicifolius]